ncbi:MAG TPA: sensor histidine kinase [Firmicutes bacterium]|jgi:signal transduction histidine kinase|nr:sensor histidine kinase [Bacillota bacterium]HBT18387.1 sensor histidine kinase [Bacillota bacterium]
MSETNNIRIPKTTDKTRSSLVLKLNLQMLARLFAGFFFINFLIIVLTLFATLWKIETGARDLSAAFKSAIENQDTQSLKLGNYQILVVDKMPKGFSLPSVILERLPMKHKGALRSFSIEKLIPEATMRLDDLRFREKIGLVRYNISFLANDTVYQVKYALGKDLRFFLSLFLILLACELLILIDNMAKGSRPIKKTLRPLSELAETARRLNEEMSSMRSGAKGSYIKDIAGVISSIDANRLDSRIAVDHAQNELKDLAYAINEMLSRINAAYQSQVRFVSDASHELRTPISVIQGYINLLDRWGKYDQKTMEEAIDAIKSETESMKELVEQLLFLARGDNETIHLNKETFDLCDLIDEIVYETQMIDPSHNYEVEIKKPAVINADRQLFKQAIRILIDNSIKYTPYGEKITIRVAATDDEAHITVQDNGIGIPTEHLADIFERFYRSDESRARKTGGSGLGLSIAKWIVERHGGHFEVLSRENIGTRITVILPSGSIV